MICVCDGGCDAAFYAAAVVEFERDKREFRRVGAGRGQCLIETSACLEAPHRGEDLPAVAEEFRRHQAAQTTRRTGDERGRPSRSDLNRVVRGRSWDETVLQARLTAHGG